MALASQFSVDHSGEVIVRNCGCGRHGLLSVFNDHDAAWKRDHRAVAIAQVHAHAAEASGFGDAGRFVAAVARLRRVQ